MHEDLFPKNHSNLKNPGSVFLLGLMGSGKTFWADKLSIQLNIPVYHLDDEIEKSEQKTIAQIFTENGEDYFRNLETYALKSFASKQNFILSVGGGTPCFNNNMDWMNDNGITIWIDESIDIISTRLLKEKSHRPLIANIPDEKLKDFLKQMHEKRKSFYNKAQHHLTEKEISEQTLLKILSANE